MAPVLDSPKRRHQFLDHAVISESSSGPIQPMNVVVRRRHEIHPVLLRGETLRLRFRAVGNLVIRDQLSVEIHAQLVEDQVEGRHPVVVVVLAICQPQQRLVHCLLQCLLPH